MPNDVIGFSGMILVGVGPIVAFVTQVAPLGKFGRQIGLFIGGALFGAGWTLNFVAGM